MSPGHRPVRRRLAIATVALVSALLVSSCGSSSEPSDQAAGDGASTPRTGGTLTFAINSPRHLPRSAPEPRRRRRVLRPADRSTRSWRSAPTARSHPWLATKWSVSPDQKTYTFTLRDDVTFTNGEKFDASAVKANLDHVVDPATKSQLAADTIATYTGTTVVSPTAGEGALQCAELGVPAIARHGVPRHRGAVDAEAAARTAVQEDHRLRPVRQRRWLRQGQGHRLHRERRRTSGGRATPRTTGVRTSTGCRSS